MKGLDPNNYKINRQWQAYSRAIHPNGPPGDCLRTGIAVLLGCERDSVPHFCREGMEHDSLWWFSLVGWCSEGGVDITFTDDPVHEGWYLMEGLSPEGQAHVVVALDGEQMWDPNPRGLGLICAYGAYVFTIRPTGRRGPDQTPA